jgi:hypothetical protein
MDSNIEKLVNMALEDGVITDKEREILFRKADALGIDLDEFEMYLENQLGRMKNNAEVNKPVSNNSVSKEENKRKELELKEHILLNQQEKEERIRIIEDNRRFRKEDEIRIKKEEDIELRSLKHFPMPVEMELRRWWDNINDKNEKERLRESIDAKKSLFGFGNFKPTEYELEEMYRKYKEIAYDRKRAEINTERENRARHEAELYANDNKELVRLGVKPTTNKEGGLLESFGIKKFW